MTRQRQNSHPSQHFKGADAVHEGGLLRVCSAYEVSHVASYGPRFSAEVGLVVDHHLDIQKEPYLKGKSLKLSTFFSNQQCYIL